MKPYALVIVFLILFSCGEDKVVLLPEIVNAKITDVLDVSAAYLFYDETQPDSVELNRKNLIGTTNWLVNVDKRLTLAQAIPKIKLLQEKKRNAKMHKNKNAKNYYTCNDITIQNLGFLEFTDVVYIEENKTILKDSMTQKLHVNFITLEHIQIVNTNETAMHIKANKNTLVKTISSFKTDKPIEVILHFDKSVSFQDYITLKAKITTLDSRYNFVNNNEFIY